MIPKSFISDLLSRIDIIDIIGSYLNLKKIGTNFRCLCPFHRENSPSFFISPKKQFYYCFGCGIHGSAISFLMSYLNITYLEAIEKIATSIGLKIPTETHVFSNQYNCTLMNQMLIWYQEKLKENQNAISYLRNRGLTGKLVKHYAIGYAPNNWKNFKEIFNSPGQDIVNQLIKTGMIFQSKDIYYDLFRNRIMFPIRTIQGQVVGFGGRILITGDPKYLNTPETPFFSKSRILYGLFENQFYIKQKGYAIVCEGYMDVISLAQYGFQNTVAVLGTLCTAYHIRILFAQTNHIIFSFDGDRAGKKAINKILKTILPIISDNKFISFLFLPDGYDPDSYVRKFGSEAFECMIKNAISLSKYLLKIITHDGENLKSIEGRANTQYRAKSLFTIMPASAFRSHIMHELCRQLSISINELEIFIGFVKTESIATQKEKIKSSIKSNVSQIIHLVRQLVEILLLHPILEKKIGFSQKNAILWIVKKHSEKMHNFLFDLFHQCSFVSNDSDFEEFQKKLSQSTFSKNYENFRKRLINMEFHFENIQEDFLWIVKKIEMQSYKEQMNTIVDRIMHNCALPEDDKIYRELTNKLK